MSSPTPSKQIVSAGLPVGAPYSAAVKSGGFIYLSGTLAEADDGAGIHGGGDVGEQTRRVIERMREVLAAAGSSLQQAVAVIVFLKSPFDFAAMNEAYEQFWPADPPTRTTVVADLVVPEALVEMSMIAVPDGVERRVIHPDSWSRSPSPYSYGIRTGDTVFLSGLVSRDGRDNSVVPGDVRAQTRVVLENAGEILAAAGLSHANVVSAKVYLTDRSTFPDMNMAYRTFFPSIPPARATVGAGLAGALYNVEITMVASSAPRRAVDDGRRSHPNLSAAILAGNRVYVSGMLGNTEQTRGDIVGQTRKTLAHIRGALEAVGSRPEHVVDALVYLTNLQHYGAMNDAYREFFGREFPARTTIRSELVPADALVEIMVTAALG